MESIDIFSRDGALIRGPVPKHAPKRPGEYSRHVLIILKTEDSPAPGAGEGLYVVQQRSLQAKHYPGKWDMTGGGVRSGEPPEAAALRELEEELSVTVPREALKPGFSYILDREDGTGLLLTVFMCRVPVPDGGFRFDPSEVNDVRIMPFREFLEHVRDHNDEAFCRGLEGIEDAL